NTLRGQENKSNYQLWMAGYYTVIHFPEQDITVLWDKKTMIHVKVGPQWKGRLAGLCGNFDKYTSNDLTTSNNMEVRNAQVFGDSWVLGQIDVTSFVKNCHTDTCNCNLGGDCECLCTSIAAYAHKCCQHGAVIHWRSPSLCAYDCEYYNQGLGEGPYILASSGENDTIIGANVSSRQIFPLPRSVAYGKVFFSFMITPGLFKDKDLFLCNTSSIYTILSLITSRKPPITMGDAVFSPKVNLKNTSTSSLSLIDIFVITKYNCYSSTSFFSRYTSKINKLTWRDLETMVSSFYMCLMEHEFKSMYWCVLYIKLRDKEYFNPATRPNDKCI
ncbi:UNVERIFIED_CONTAM: hypothetical protein H355_008111, partial [Colinus virginianus]